MNVGSFAVIGGDKRQLYAAAAMQNDGYKVYICGFDQLYKEWNIEGCALEYAIQNADCTVLPMPVTKDGKTLHAPFADVDIYLDDNFAQNFVDKRVFCTMSDKLLKLSSVWKKAKLFDYLNREELAIQNAVPSAEGAIEIAIKEYEGTIHGSKCLVTGFGRIGKVLAKMLDGLGAQVFAAARKKSDLALINALGFNAVDINNLPAAISCPNIIFNTVPAIIFDSHTLAKICKSALVIDLASSPGGVDFESANRLGIRTIHALSLPGKVAPKTSGEIIKNTILNMLEED